MHINARPLVIIVFLMHDGMHITCFIKYLWQVSSNWGGGDTGGKLPP